MYQSGAILSGICLFIVWLLSDGESYLFSLYYLVCSLLFSLYFLAQLETHSDDSKPTPITGVKFSANNLISCHQNQKLEVSGEKISIVDKGIFTVLSNIVHLEICNTKLEMLPEFTNCETLTTLILSDNTIEKLSGSEFKNLPNLTILKMNNNHLSQLKPFDEMFSNNLNLEEVDLSENYIALLPQTDYTKPSGMKSIRKLNLSNNLLDVLHEFDFKGFESLEYLDLSFNSLISFKIEKLGKMIQEKVNPTDQSTCLKFMKHLTNVKTLDLRNNQIIAFELSEKPPSKCKILLHGNPILEKIDIHRVHLENFINCQTIEQVEYLDITTGLDIEKKEKKEDTSSFTSHPQCLTETSLNYYTQRQPNETIKCVLHKKRSLLLNIVKLYRKYIGLDENSSSMNENEIFTILRDAFVIWHEIRDGISIDDICEEFANEFPGMYTMKKYLKETGTYCANLLAREEEPTGVNYCFIGQPGVGKTSIAKYLPRILQKYGIIAYNRLHITGNELKGSFVGEAQKNMNKKFENSKGGVLFIDEAYSLLNSKYGMEAIDTLNENMTKCQEGNDKYSRTVVIVAGYKKDMEEFMQVNPGLPRRFSKYIDFGYYTKGQLLEIALSIIKKKDGKILPFGDEEIQELKQIFAKVEGDPTFGNAGGVISLIRKAEFHCINDANFKHHCSIEIKVQHIQKAFEEFRKNLINEDLLKVLRIQQLDGYANRFSNHTLQTFSALDAQSLRDAFRISDSMDRVKIQNLIIAYNHAFKDFSGVAPFILIHLLEFGFIEKSEFFQIVKERIQFTGIVEEKFLKEMQSKCNDYNDVLEILGDTNVIQKIIEKAKISLQDRIIPYLSSLVQALRNIRSTCNITSALTFNNLARTKEILKRDDHEILAYIELAKYSQEKTVELIRVTKNTKPSKDKIFRHIKKEHDYLIFFTEKALEEHPITKMSIVFIAPEIVGSFIDFVFTKKWDLVHNTFIMATEEKENFIINCKTSAIIIGKKMLLDLDDFSKIYKAISNYPNLGNYTELMVKANCLLKDNLQSNTKQVDPKILEDKKFLSTFLDKDEMEWVKNLSKNKPNK